jgi:cleavage and polyadenylation specificity factor subunit 2
MRLRVTPIYGSRWSPVGQPEEPSCTLIEYGGCRVLWNVGWTAVQDPSTFPELPDHDCLIITDSTLQACGGLPLYHHQQGLLRAASSNGNGSRVPIYATFPTVKMGQMALYDQHAAVSLDGGCPAYTLADLDNVFDNTSIHAIKYSQTVMVYHPETGQACLSITAHRAGHVVGGAFYLVQRLQDETVVVLTGKYHIAKELHLDSSNLLQHGSTPDVLVTTAGGPAFRQFKALAHGTKPALPFSQLVTQQERGLTETILSVLRRDGNVLLPTDASGRVLELILLLNQHWERHRLQAAYNLCWLGPMVTNTAEFARSQLEWMGTALGYQFDSAKGHPFNLKAVNFCSSVAELMTVMQENQNPVCVLATGASLEGGPARDMLLKWAENPDNAVIFTDSSQAYLRRQVVSTGQAGDESTAAAAVTASTKKGDDLAPVAPAITPETAAATVPTGEDDAADEAEGMVGSAVTQASEWTTAGQLLSAWAKAKAAGREMDDSVTIDVNVPHRAPLVGPELKVFLANEEAERLKQLKEEEKRAMLREVELAKGQLRLGEEDTMGPTATEGKTSSGTTAVSSSRPRKKSRFDSSLFLKFSKPLHCTYSLPTMQLTDSLFDRSTTDSDSSFSPPSS